MISLFNNSLAPSVFQDDFFMDDFFGRKAYRRPRTARSNFFSNCNNNIFTDDYFNLQPVRRIANRNRQPFDILFDGFFNDDIHLSTERRPVPNKWKINSNAKNCQGCNNCNRENIDPEVNNELNNRKTENKPRVQWSSFKRNYVNNNGNETTIDKKTFTKDDKTETFVTKITKDIQGNENKMEIKPENYDNELKAIYDRMEESGAILQEVKPLELEAENDDKMEEENIKSNSFVDDKSNESGEKMFSDIKF